MSGAKYEYDNNGLYFYYFVSSVLSLLLVPWTYYVWTAEDRAAKAAKKEHWECTCEGCAKKRAVLQNMQQKKSKITWTHIGLAAGWLVFAYFAYCAGTARLTEAKLWDPFEILGLREGASAADVRRAFRKLSLVYHPDKVDADKKNETEGKYVELTKAYKALTDDEARKNWEEFGHPDGKQSISVGIALPAWLVEAGARYKVLAVYGLIFGIILPVVVARWWQQSKTLTKDQILNETMAKFFREMKDNMKWNDLLILLSTAAEFRRESVKNPEGLGPTAMAKPEKAGMQKLFAATRDAMEERCGEKLERPKKLMDDEVAWKVYLLLMSHISRAELNDEGLEDDRRFVVSKAAHLLGGMMQLATSRFFVINMVSLMDLGQILVQASHPLKMGPLWQLPYMSEEIMKHTKSKKRNIVSVYNVRDMPEADRRDLFRSLTDEQYDQLVAVANKVPRIEIEKAEARVIGEEEIETNALLTVFVKLKLAKPGEKDGEKKDGDKEKKEAEKGKDGKEKEKGDGKAEESSADEDDDEEEEEKLPEWWEKREHNTEPVHAPFWPAEKRPGWWVFLAAPGGPPRIVSGPAKITDLADTKTVRLQFQAPPNPGTFQLLAVFTVKKAVERPVEDFDDDISEPDEDTFAGQLALARQELAELAGAKPAKKAGKVKGAAEGGKAGTAKATNGKPAEESEEDSDSSDDSSDEE
ncbi:Sec63 Brl domain-containing protein [Hyaloraphidium curvatum]|nr:Sec63 Brl domain-containing protein [Hyaloraphidium curvatum]